MQQKASCSPFILHKKESFFYDGSAEDFRSHSLTLIDKSSWAAIQNVTNQNTIKQTQQTLVRGRSDIFIFSERLFTFEVNKLMYKVCQIYK